MAFDKSLDKEMFKETVDFDTTRVTVAVYAYNEGTPKLQISRENMNPNEGNWTWTKLGRMVKIEAEAVLPLIQKALKHM
jgi:hypothetical protein